MLIPYTLPIQMSPSWGKEVTVRNKAYNLKYEGRMEYDHLRQNRALVHLQTFSSHPNCFPGFHYILK